MTTKVQSPLCSVAGGEARSAIRATPTKRPSLLALGTEPLRASIELMRHLFGMGWNAAVMDVVGKQLLRSCVT